MTITVYGASLSPFVRKVRVALIEKGLDYEHVQVDPFRPPENYRELSPFGRIPALRDGDNLMADSAVICTYLEAQYPQVPLSYRDPALQARVQWFEKFGDAELAPVTTFGVFGNRVIKKLLGNPCDDAHVATCLETRLPPLLDYLEANAPKDGFIVGDRLTIADIAIATQFVNLGFASETIDATRWPLSAAYVSRILARPSFAPLAAQEQGYVSKILSR